MLEVALKSYYELEEKARDPQHAHLIEVVEKIREAYEREFGGPIPVKGKWGA
jgi:hypothetical protein